MKSNFEVNAAISDYERDHGYKVEAINDQLWTDGPTSIYNNGGACPTDCDYCIIEPCTMCAEKALVACETSLDTTVPNGIFYTF